jgi:3-hydroxyisobutyrate dehydrogenase-like beta-hydroxyacid dehydrogenase
MPEKIGVVGLGLMGSGMAQNLLAKGHTVAGYDVDISRLRAMADRGVMPMPSAGTVAVESDLVVLSLPTTSALAEVVAEIATRAHQGLVCLETGTLPLGDKLAARDLLAQAGVDLMDTPLSGTGLQAADGSLVVYASGTRDGYERARVVFDAIGRSTHYLGEFGNGSKMKFIANLLVAIHNLATAEAHALGIAAGMDPALVQQVIADGVGSSKIFEIRGPKMVGEDYSPAARLDLMVKDSAIIKDFALGEGAVTPLLDAAIPVYLEASASGLGDLDAAALCLHLERLAGTIRSGMADRGDQASTDEGR